MDRGCRTFKKGDNIKGLLIMVEPYKIPGDKNYRSIVKCTLCDSEPYEIVLSEINRHVFDGCGCQKNRSNSSNWQSFQDWCVKNNRKDLLDLWDYDLNVKNPDQISCCTSSSYYFKCGAGIHESTLHNISCVTTQYSNKKMCKKCNSFAQYAINKFGENVLDLYWDYDKNVADPWEISHSSRIEIWIKCLDVSYHESYSTLPSLFLKEVGCPYCHCNRVHPYDSFAYFYTQKYGDDFLDRYWDYDVNTLNPWEIAVQTNKGHVYLKCEKHGSYPVMPTNFYKCGIACPECSRERDQSRLQEKVVDYLNSIGVLNILHEYNCSIIAKNPNTNRLLPYDNDVVINDATHLIIEVMGEQHYSAKSGLVKRQAADRNKSAEQVFADIQCRDEYKKQYALSQGYYYLAIPYWTENDESYKSLIDNKIKEILTIQN